MTKSIFSRFSKRLIHPKNKAPKKPKNRSVVSCDSYVGPHDIVVHPLPAVTIPSVTETSDGTSWIPPSPAISRRLARLFLDGWPSHRSDYVEQLCVQIRDGQLDLSSHPRSAVRFGMFPFLEACLNSLSERRMLCRWRFPLHISTKQDAALVQPLLWSVRCIHC